MGLSSSDVRNNQLQLSPSLFVCCWHVGLFRFFFQFSMKKFQLAAVGHSFNALQAYSQPHVMIGSLQFLLTILTPIPFLTAPATLSLEFIVGSNGPTWNIEA